MVAPTYTSLSQRTRTSTHLEILSTAAQEDKVPEDPPPTIARQLKGWREREGGRGWAGRSQGPYRIHAGIGTNS